MKMKKRLSAALLALCMAASMTACGDKTESSSKAAETTAASAAAGTKGAWWWAPAWARS